MGGHAVVSGDTHMLPTPAHRLLRETGNPYFSEIPADAATSVVAGVAASPDPAATR
jgi:hypothetical protein